jgi:hypothetical protein
LLPWPDVVCCISDLLIESRTVNCRQTGEPLALGLMRMYPDLPFWPDRHLFQLMNFPLRWITGPKSEVVLLFYLYGLAILLVGLTLREVILV